MNEIGRDPAGANEAMSDGKDLPWLQEVASDPVWDVWNVVYRDVVVLDGANEVYGVFNLTEHNLTDSGNRDALEALMLEAWEHTAE